MQKKTPFFLSFLIFSSISVFLLLLSLAGASEPLRGTVQFLLVPVQKTLFTAYADMKNNSDSVIKEDETIRLLSLQIKEQELEIKALRDQFNVTQPNPQNLLPAHVIGFESFIPGISIPERITIDKGSKDGVKVGHIVVIRDILLGKVTKVSKNISVLEVATKKGFSITARTSNTNAIGIIKGQGSSLLLDNVILSEELKKDDFIVTKGSIDSNGIGSPPGLVIGKIISINKSSSSLFQTAEVAPLLDPSKLALVFIILPE